MAAPDVGGVRFDCVTRGILYLLGTAKWKELDGSIQVVKSRVFILVFLVVVLVFAFAYFTGFGILSDTQLWNVPGVPISGTQMFFAVTIFACLLVLEWVLAEIPRFAFTPLGAVGNPAACLPGCAVLFGETRHCSVTVSLSNLQLPTLNRTQGAMPEFTTWAHYPFCMEMALTSGDIQINRCTWYCWLSFTWSPVTITSCWNGCSSLFFL